MMNLTPKEVINTTPPKKFDLPFTAPEKMLNELMVEKLKSKPSYQPLGGTYETNPFKRSYDLIQAKNFAELKTLERSWLWSPFHRPSRVVPWLFAVGLSLGGFVVFLEVYHRPSQRIKYKMFEKYKVKREVIDKMIKKGWFQDKYFDEIYGDLFAVPQAKPEPEAPKIDRTEALTQLEHLSGERKKLAGALKAAAEGREQDELLPALR